jgi:hypothetical protein
MGDSQGSSQDSSWRELRRVKGSKTQVQLKRDGRESCAACDRKADESLILRLKTYARKLGLFWQA